MEKNNQTIITTKNLEMTLKKKLNPQKLEVIDESYQHLGHQGSNGLGYGTHFKVKIYCQEFTNLSRVECHRLVYDSLSSFQTQGLHALAIEILK